jgi:hypothetical protein
MHQDAPYVGIFGENHIVKKLVTFCPNVDSEG